MTTKKEMELVKEAVEWAREEKKKRPRFEIQGLEGDCDYSNNEYYQLVRK